MSLENHTFVPRHCHPHPLGQIFASMKSKLSVSCCWILQSPFCCDLGFWFVFVPWLLLSVHVNLPSPFVSMSASAFYIRFGPSLWRNFLSSSMSFSISCHKCSKWSGWQSQHGTCILEQMPHQYAKHASISCTVKSNNVIYKKIACSQSPFEGPCAIVY